jgi:hypothetical protein
MAPPFAWSTYGLVERDGELVFTQSLAASAGTNAGEVGWQGDERVAVRLHLPSRISFHNSTGRAVERGNIVTWEQSLSARARSEPLDIEVHLDRDSILFTTLLLFGGTAALALATLGLFVWWVRRMGKPSVPGSPA